MVLHLELVVKPEHRAEFLEALWADANGALDNEEGCLRFDVTVDPSAPLPRFLVKRAKKIVLHSATERLRERVMTSARAQR